MPTPRRDRRDGHAVTTPCGQPSTSPSQRRAAPDPTTSTAALFDPTSYLKLADEGSGRGGDTDYVNDGGTEVIEGVQTHRYGVGCVFKPEPASQCHLRDLGPIADALPATGTLLIDYWLDRDSQPRKLTVSGVLDDHNRSQPPVGIDITMTLDQFGAPVDITPPPQADTVTCHQAKVDVHCG